MRNIFQVLMGHAYQPPLFYPAKLPVIVERERKPLFGCGICIYLYQLQNECSLKTIMVITNEEWGFNGNWKGRKKGGGVK